MERSRRRAIVVLVFFSLFAVSSAVSTTRRSVGQASFAFANSPMQLRGLASCTFQRAAKTHCFQVLRRNLVQTRRSGIANVRATIASLYQAKGRTEEALKEVAQQLSHKKFTLDIAAVLALEAQRRTVQTEVDQAQQERNAKSKSIGQLKAKGQDVSQIMGEVEGLKAKLQAGEQQLKSIEEQIEEMLLTVPNAPHPTVPIGQDEAANVEVRKWGSPRTFDFPIKDHVDVGAHLLGMDFALASKITGTRFVVLQGQLAKMHRALVQYMLDTHTQKHDYTEMYVPYIVNSDSLKGTGQLPKFKEDLFALTKTQDKEFFLIPTAEVPVTNMVRDTITPADQLPLRYTAHTPCFRSEAGSYGRDTRGLIRQHQFEKVEMVQIVNPATSYAALEEMTGHAEAILKGLGLPYRVIELCSGDLGFSAAKTYDLEVWLPAQKTYREISSCSNCEDFQSRRMMARWRNPETKSNELVHTLNGSGLAVGRTLVAILENFQQADGSVEVPEALRPYMGGLTHLRPKEPSTRPAPAPAAKAASAAKA